MRSRSATPKALTLKKNGLWCTARVHCVLAGAEADSVRE